MRKFIIVSKTYLTQRRDDAGTQRNFYKKSFATLRLCVFALTLCFPICAQKIAVLTPDKITGSRIFAAELGKVLSKNHEILDYSSSETAFDSAGFENPFNLSAEESKNVGRAIGCNYFLLIRHETLRRASFEKDEYYESYAVIYAVSSRTGNLVFWKLNSFEADKPSEAEKKSFDSIGKLAKEISGALQEAKIREIALVQDDKIEEMPAENSPAAKNFRPPLPFRRISPAYTAAANFYNIRATIDILVDVDETGKIRRTEITRWAGYGLDESVTEAVKKMNWRPADRNGKTLPMRILLRYNFKDIDDEN